MLTDEEIENILCVYDWFYQGLGVVPEWQRELFESVMTKLGITQEMAEKREYGHLFPAGKIK